MNDKQIQLAIVLNSLRTTVVLGSRDWSLDKRDAWIYGILIGWQLPYEDRPSGLKDCSAEDWERMQSYHKTLWATLHKDKED